MRQLLFPTDFSPTANNAFGFTLQLARKLKAEIILFHAFNFTTAQALLAPAEVLEEASAVRHDKALANFQEYEKQALETLGYPIKIHHVIRPGFAADVILELCEEYEPYLVVMGTKGSNNIAHDVFGSVSTAVMKRCPYPVLAIPEHAEYKGLKKVAYATDLKENNMRDLYRLAQIARQIGASVCSVHVVKDSNISKADLMEMEDNYTMGMEFDTMPLHVLDGKSVHRGLSKFLKKESIDLLAIHPHRRNFFNELFNPSLTQRMALHAQIPVLAMHG